MLPLALVSAARVHCDGHAAILPRSRRYFCVQFAGYSWERGAGGTASSDWEYVRERKARGTGARSTINKACVRYYLRAESLAGECIGSEQGACQ